MVQRADVGLLEHGDALVIAKPLVQLMGAHIHCDDRNGSGLQQAVGEAPGG